MSKGQSAYFLAFPADGHLQRLCQNVLAMWKIGEQAKLVCKHNLEEFLFKFIIQLSK